MPATAPIRKYRICITTNVPITIAERAPGYRSRSFLDTVMLHSFYGPLVQYSKVSHLSGLSSSHLHFEILKFNLEL